MTIGTAHDVKNYFVGKGILLFKPDGDADFRDLGNAPKVTVTPDVTTLDHFSSRSGVKSKDLTIITERKMTVAFTLDEITPENLAMALFGTVDRSNADGPMVKLMAATAVQGALRLVGTNDYGAKCTVDLWNISIRPTGDVGFITDEFGEIDYEADVLLAPGTPAIAAKQTYTATALADGDTLTIGGKVYTFEDSLTNVNGHVAIGDDLAETLANLAAAINLNGTAGTDYAAATTLHPTVTAAAGATTLVATAKTGGTGGNAIATTDTATGGAWGAATLAGGVAGDANAGEFGQVVFTNVAPS